MPNALFNHDAHLRNLDEAERVLRQYDHHDLAGAVGRAKAIHIDMQGRIAEAQRMGLEVIKLVDRANHIYANMHQYIFKPEAPWIGTDLFPVKKPEDD